jgi:hypothetical protein
MRLLLCPLLVSAFQLFSFSAFPQITLAWDPSPGTNIIASYQIYWGTSSHAYSNSVSAGLTNTATISIPAGPIYIAATAVDENGLESDFSNEVIYSNEAPAKTNLQVTITTTGTSILYARSVLGPWTATNRTALFWTNPIPPWYFRSRGWTSNKVTITATPF